MSVLGSFHHRLAQLGALLVVLFAFESLALAQQPPDATAVVAPVAAAEPQAPAVPPPPPPNYPPPQYGAPAPNGLPPQYSAPPPYYPPPYAPSPERARRLESAYRMRTAGITLLAIGGALVPLGIIITYAAAVGTLITFGATYPAVIGGVFTTLVGSAALVAGAPLLAVGSVRIRRAHHGGYARLSLLPDLHTTPRETRAGLMLSMTF